LIETTIARDVLLQTRVDKPAVLRRLFELGFRYSGQMLSYTKMLGQLQDAGNSSSVDLWHGSSSLAAARRRIGPPARAIGKSAGAKAVLENFVIAGQGLAIVPGSIRFHVR
jgi:hypothetical protein